MRYPKNRSVNAGGSVVPPPSGAEEALAPYERNMALDPPSWCGAAQMPVTFRGTTSEMRYFKIPDGHGILFHSRK
jgi:hypothetical protein